MSLLDDAIGYDEELLALIVKSAKIVDNRVVDDIDKILEFNGEVGEDDGIV